MNAKQESKQRPHVIAQSFKPVSVFICPCRSEPDKLEELIGKARTDPAERGGLQVIETDSFEEQCLHLSVKIHPKFFFLRDLNWIASVLIAELSSADGASITFEQILAFNTNFRVCQGVLERPDSPAFGLEKCKFCLSENRDAPQIFKDIVCRSIDSYKPHESLKRAVTLSIVEFDRELDDTELYLYGTIAHSDEVVDPAWATAKMQEQAYDRWRPNGIRMFVHSYSLVCSCGPSRVENNRDMAWLYHIFLGDYVKIGVRMALERASLLELRDTLQEVATIGELRQLRKYWVNSRRMLAVPWAVEGTQKVHNEQTWRRVSGIDRMSKEIDKRFEQNVGFFEAEAADRLNKLLLWFQVFVVGISAAIVVATLEASKEWFIALPLTAGIGLLVMILCWLWLQYGLRYFRKKKM